MFHIWQTDGWAVAGIDGRRCRVGVADEPRPTYVSGMPRAVATFSFKSRLRFTPLITSASINQSLTPTRSQSPAVA